MPLAGHGPVVAIIGGGFTGAAIAFHLERQLAVWSPARIIVIEPRASLGAGLAYATPDPAHRINVPSSRMSLDPGQPQDFDAWLNAHDHDPEAALPDGRRFPRRANFGRYMADRLRPVLARGRIVHRRTSAVRIEARGQGYAIALGDRETVTADVVVIAATHPPAAIPPVFAEALRGDIRLIGDAAQPGALDAVEADEHVLVVGTGLTMADVVASLDARGHRGPVTVFSRRGQLPAQHAAAPVLPFGDFLSQPDVSARALVRRVRAAVAAAGAAGLPPQAVFDALRAQGRGIWQSLPLVEQRRLVRHLRVFWDARRFRIAPQVQDVLERRKQAGLFRVIAGRATAVTPRAGGIEVTLATRQGGGTLLTCARVVIATGPAHGAFLSTARWLAPLADAGLVRPDDLGLGIATDVRSRALGRDGAAAETLFIGGPLARGAFGELMGLPEVARQAVDIAGEIARLLARREQAAAGTWRQLA